MVELVSLLPRLDSSKWAPGHRNIEFSTSAGSSSGVVSGHSHFRSVWRLVFAVLVLAVCPDAGAEVGDCEMDFNKVNAVARNMEASGREKEIALFEVFRKIYPAAPNSASSLSALTDECLKFRFRSLQLVNFYVGDNRLLADMADSISHLTERRIVTDFEREGMLRALIAARRFDEARRYASQHPLLAVGEAIPRVEYGATHGAGPGAFVVSEGDVLHYRDYELGGALQLVVVAHPLCAYSRRAMEVLEGDRQFGEVRKSVIWLAPVDQRLHLEAIRSWNARHPGVEVVIARHRSDWPFIDQWSTPVFYVLRDGLLVGKVVGWTGEVSRSVLIDLLSHPSSDVSGS